MTSDGELPGAQRRVLRQLVESLVFEGLVVPRPDGAAGPSPSSGPDAEAWALDAPGLAGVAYRWRARRRFSFGRTSVVGPIVRAAPGGDAEPTIRRAVAELAPLLRAAPDRVAGLVDELERTARNDADALAAWRRRPVPDLDADLHELEAWTVAGHPYHPSYKSRVGFDPDDNRRFGPEFAPTVRPLWLAVPAAEVEVTAVPGLRPAAYVHEDLGPATVARFRRRLGHWAPGAGPDDHAWVPVHPWQWRERLAARLAPEVAAGRVVELGEADDDHRPQQSIRTLANATDPARASLKLSLGIVNTSTARTLAPHTLRNGPLVTAWLRGLVAADPVLGEELRTGVLGEVLTASYAGPGPPLPAGPDGDLGCLWREGVAAHLGPGERAVPFTTLAQRGPDGTPWLARMIAGTGEVDRERVDRWAARFLDVAITPVAHLLCAHGIALEAHAQNLLLVHRAGWPERLVVRDLHDGIRFSPAHLADPGGMPPLAPTPAAHLRVNRNSFVEADDATAVRDFVHDAFFFVNLAEVAFVLADDLGLGERRFWSLARGVLERHRHRLPARPTGTTTTGPGAFDLLAPTVGIEQLTTRRLLPDDRLRITAAPNPLSTAPAAVPAVG